MKTKIMRGLVTSVTEVSDHLRKITFRLSHGLEYQPGQSVRIYNKLYPLCGGPEVSLRTNAYEILVEKQTPGRLKPALESVKVGDFLPVEGPFGEFYPLSAEPFEETVWLATPSQVGSFLSCIHSKKFLGLRPIRILLVVEMAEEKDFPFREVFEAQGVTVISCVKQPTRWVDGFWGKMADCLKSKRWKLDFGRARFFLAVDEALEIDLSSVLIEERKVTPSKIEYLNFPGVPQEATVIPLVRRRNEEVRFLKAA